MQLKNKKKINKISLFKPQVRSRHPTHQVLREKLVKLPFKTIVRLGSTTDLPDTTTNGGNRIELNTINAINTSSSKFKMKHAFKEAGVKTAEYYTVNEVKEGLENWEVFPLVAKINFGSRGVGMFLLETKEDLEKFMQDNPSPNKYYFERFYNYSREYRLHVTNEGCFYTCRKMLKTDTPDDERWYRNDSNCTWIIESNELFDKPKCWDKIVSECIKALNAVGLDVGACDVKVQSTKDQKGRIRNEVDFIIIEINSAPSFGEITAEKYLEQIPKILLLKYGSLLHKL